MKTDAMAVDAARAGADPVFDRCWWLYSLCRERLFADHTETIVTALAPLLRSRPRLQLVELGCGPGFYSRRLAARFPCVQAIGIDTSERLLSHARVQASRAHLDNCQFLQRDAQQLCDCAETADVAIASRFFLVLAQREQVLRVIFETLRPGGLFFVAEPLSPFRTAVPLWLMRAVDTMNGRDLDPDSQVHCNVLSHEQFVQLMGAAAWSKVALWRDKRYQYALCEKAS
ncbi:MAG TPA: class I SAM-dependent methyltransferase [Acidobacteriaceae bacterium]